MWMCVDDQAALLVMILLLYQAILTARLYSVLFQQDASSGKNCCPGGLSGSNNYKHMFGVLPRLHSAPLAASAATP
jgi:hypothetical protein